jgi:protein gp37
MSDGTKIEWTDATWNPITGCSVVSAGCKHCYAMKLAGTRMRNHPSRAGLTISTKAGPVWNGETRINHDWLTQPLEWKRPRMIFVCAHGDLFHESVSDTTIAGIFGIMAASPHHTFQVLTKRARRAEIWFNSYMSHNNAGAILHEAAKGLMGYDHPKRPGIDMHQRWPLPNVWLGVSVEDQEAANERIPQLLQCPAAVRFLSCEPILGRIDLCELLGMWWNQTMQCWEGVGREINRHRDGRPRIGWVIAGGESGHGARIMHSSWIRSLRDQCVGAGVPFFFKQWGEWTGPGFSFPDGDPKAIREDELARYRVGKKAAGRELDGRTWDEMPQVAA